MLATQKLDSISGRGTRRWTCPARPRRGSRSGPRCCAPRRRGPLFAWKLRRVRTRSSSCSAGARTTWSTSRSRFRRASTISTAPSTRLPLRSARRSPRRRLCLEDLDPPLRRVRRQGRTVVCDVRPAGRVANRRRRQRDPGPRLRADLHEGARPRPAVGCALARGARGRRAGDGALKLVFALLVAVVLAAATAYLFVWPDEDAPTGARTRSSCSRVDSTTGSRRRLAAPASRRRWRSPTAANGWARQPALRSGEAVCFDPAPYSTRGEARWMPRGRAAGLGLGRRRHVDVPRTEGAGALRPLLRRPVGVVERSFGRELHHRGRLGMAEILLLPRLESGLLGTTSARFPSGCSRSSS